MRTGTILLRSSGIVTRAWTTIILHYCFASAAVTRVPAEGEADGQGNGSGGGTDAGRIPRVACSVYIALGVECEQLGLLEE